MKRPSEPSAPADTIRDINPISRHTQKTKFRTNLNYSLQDSFKNLPDSALLGNRDDCLKICAPLYNASCKGDWEAAKVILDKRQNLVAYAITENYDTVLHIAASAKSTKLVEDFVENLVNQMTKEELELQNINDNTALCLAAASGNIQLIKIMVKKNKQLLEIPGSQRMMPLYMASLYGQREMVNYLYDNSENMSGDFWTDEMRIGVLYKCVEADIFDVAVKIMTKYPSLAIGGNSLRLLALKSEALRTENPHLLSRIIRPILAVIQVKCRPSKNPSDAMNLLRIILADVMKLPKREINKIIKGPADKSTISEEGSRGKEKYSSGILFVAAENGNTEFLVEVLRLFPELLWTRNDNNQTIFHVAISHRHEGIYNLLNEVGSMKSMVIPLLDENENNMLHLVAKRAKKKRLQITSGVALQMQRELLWFKEIEAMIPRSYRQKKNKDGLTPHELFTKEHKDLKSADEMWMKDTASQSMVVAALIATVVFAAAFTVPGGYNQSDGVPVFLHRISFISFVISDAISLTFSSISILIFLSILTSRYAEQDFLEVLPNRLMRGLASLFFSITTMMIAFSQSFFVLYRNNLVWIPIVISLISSYPVFLYVRLQYDLLMDVYDSTYGSKNLFNPKKLLINYQNPKL